MLEQSEYKVGSTALWKQDRMLQDLVAVAQEPIWVDPTIPADVTPKKRDGRDEKGTAGEGEIQPQADAIEKIVTSEDRVMQAEDGTKILVKAGHTLALETKDSKPLYHEFVLFPGQHDFLESGVLATVQEVQAEQEAAHRQMMMAEELSFTAMQAATMARNVTPERLGEAASVTMVRGMLPVSAKAASPKNITPKTIMKVQEQEQKGTTTEEGGKADSPQKSLPEIVMEVQEQEQKSLPKIVQAAVPDVAPEMGGDGAPSMETITAKEGPAQLVSYATSESGEGSGSSSD